MEKLYFDCLGSEHPHFLLNWQWFCNQILLTNNVQIIDCKNSKYQFTFLWYIEHKLRNNELDLFLDCLDSNKTLIISDILNYNDYYNSLYLEISNQIKKVPLIFLTNNYLLPHVLNNQRIIVYDFLFNRTKLYYFNQEYIFRRSDLNLWYHAGKGKYKIVDEKKVISKHFLAAFRDMRGERLKLFNFLQKSSKGFIGCHDFNMYLPGEEHLNKEDIFYYPMPENLYKHTFASIYIESTCVFPYIFHATEKTFEPLLKGSFILPFSNPCFVRNLQNIYDFKFPAELDYSYLESTISVEQKFELYTNVLQDFLNIPVNDLVDIYNNNLDVIEHNRQIFRDRGYDNSIVDLLN